MTVKITKPKINVREELNDLKKPTGIAGEAMLRAETPQEQFNLIGAGRRNLLINGAMQVAQRGTSGTTTGTDNYLIDRFSMSRFGGYPNNTTQSQTTDAPEGFYNSFKMLRTSAHTLTGTNATAFFQRLEGLNTSHLKWGTALAKPVVVSFWVKSNQTGQFPLILADSGNAVDIGKLYEINSANTWEYKTIAIEAPSAGTFDTDNTTGMVVYWGFGSTSSARTAQGTTWGSSNSSGSSKAMVTGASTALATTNGATWQITGIQLELGKVATPFEHRSYGEELALCQRYYYRLNVRANIALMVGNSLNTTSAYYTLALPQPLRATPTVSQSGFVNYRQRGGGVNVTSTVTLGTPHYYLGSSILEIDASVSSGLPNTIQTMVYSSTGNDGYIEVKAEL